MAERVCAVNGHTKKPATRSIVVAGQLGPMWLWIRMVMAQGINWHSNGCGTLMDWAWRGGGHCSNDNGCLVGSWVGLD